LPIPAASTRRRAITIRPFGGSGFVATDISVGDEAFAVAVQPDGKIVAARTTKTAAQRAAPKKTAATRAAKKT